MNTGRYILFAMAALAFASCEKSIEQEAGNEPVGEVGTIIFSATLDGKAPDSKAVIGTNPETGKPLNFWENGDEITVYSQGKGDSGTHDGYTFSTSLGANASSADFTYTGDGWVDGSAYMAIYPATGRRTVNFTGEGEIYKMAAVDVPHSQTLVANSFDRSAMVATAYSTDNTFAFKSAVALLKFRVSDSDVVSGKFVVDDADAISGRFRADLSTVAPYDPVLTDYGQATHSFVDFTIDGSTPFSTGTDYYVAVRPTTLTSVFKVYLNGKLVKSLPVAKLAEFARNKIYNLGTLSVPSSPVEKILDFNFNITPQEGWPTSANSETRADGGMTCTYVLGGSNYDFVLADPKSASGSNIYWSTNATASYGYRIVFASEKRYMGLPAISGYKLTHITCVSTQLNDGAASTTPKMGVVTGIVTANETPEYVTGGDAKTWAKGNNHNSYDYSLSGTSDNTMYYLYAAVKGAIRSVSLTYEPV